jgi:hypothetical protein
MEIITEALIDTGKLVPFLAAIYFVVGLLEYRYGFSRRTGTSKRDGLGLGGDTEGLPKTRRKREGSTSGIQAGRT